MSMTDYAARSSPSYLELWPGARSAEIPGLGSPNDEAHSIGRWIRVRGPWKRIVFSLDVEIMLMVS